MVVVGVNNTSTTNTSKELGYDVEGDFLPGEVAERRHGKSDLVRNKCMTM